MLKHKHLSVVLNKKLRRGLVGYWPLDEASGNRGDKSIWQNTLTDNNTVLHAGGPDGQRVARFTLANSEYLSVADNATLSMGDIDFSVTAWVYLESAPASEMDLVAKWTTVTANREYLLFWDNSLNRFTFFVSQDGTNITSLAANTFGAASTETWYFLVAWHDATANTINISVNNGTADSTAHTTGCYDGTATFTIGARATPASYFDGRASRVGLWKKVLTAAEITSLYNGGLGMDYSDLSGSLLTSLVGYWNLDEASGTRNDSAGTSHLTDNATVTESGGKLGRAAQFVRANSESLSLSDNAALSTTDQNFTIACWVYFDTIPGLMDFVSKWTTSSENREYLLAAQTGVTTFVFWVSPDGTNLTEVTGISFGAASVATWYFVVAWHDAAKDTLNIQINNGAVDSAAHTTGAYDGTTAFNLGRRDTPANYLDGRMNGVGVWKRRLSAAERTYLYNNGNGQRWPWAK